MNKKDIIAKAKNAIELYNSFDEDKRNYDHENWHCINVKRGSDYVDIDDILKKYNKKDYAKIKDFLSSEDDEIDRTYYDNWLCDSWEMLEVDLTENDELSLEYITRHGEVRTEDYKTQCNKCYRKTWYETKQPCKCENCNGELIPITRSQVIDDRKYIYSLGNSGGWACFQDSIGGRAEELEEWIDEGGYYDFNEYKDDIILSTKDLLQAIDEITALKEYIKNYNNRLSFRDEVIYRIDEFLDEEADLNEDYKFIYNSIEPKIHDIDIIFNRYIADDKIKSDLKRLTNSIKAYTKKLF